MPKKKRGRTRRKNVKKRSRKIVKKRSKKTPRARGFGYVEIKRCDITHELGFVDPDRTVYYNEGMKRLGRTPKSLQYIKDLPDDTLFMDFKTNYEHDNLVKGFCWPKRINDDPINLGELDKSIMIEHILSICKKQPDDEILIAYSRWDPLDEVYNTVNRYPCKCSEIALITRTMNYVLKKLQKFPFTSYSDYDKYVEYYNPFRADFGTAYVNIAFGSQIDEGDY